VTALLWITIVPGHEPLARVLERMVEHGTAADARTGRNIMRSIHRSVQKHTNGHADRAKSVCDATHRSAHMPAWTDPNNGAGRLAQNIAPRAAAVRPSMA
jgi:hypothetical protein